MQHSAEPGAAGTARAPLDHLLAACREARSPCGDGEMVWRIWGEETGQLDPVVLLHGGFGSWNHWVRTIPVLTASGRQVIAPDLPGCGDSADPPEPYDIASLAELLSDGLDAVLPGDQPFRLVSFSFGGLLSPHLARAQARRIAGITLVGTPLLGLKKTGPANQLTAVPPDASPQQAADIYRANLEKLMVRNPAAVDDLAMALHLENMEKARLRSRTLARKTVLADLLDDLPCPIGYVFGDHDVTLDPDLEGIRAWVSEDQPTAKVQVFEDTGHWVPYEAAGGFNELLLELLSSGG